MLNGLVPYRLQILIGSLILGFVTLQFLPPWAPSIILLAGASFGLLTYKIVRIPQGVKDTMIAMVQQLEQNVKLSERNLAISRELYEIANNQLSASHELSTSTTEITRMVETTFAEADSLALGSHTTTQEAQSGMKTLSQASKTLHDASVVVNKIAELGRSSLELVRELQQSAKAISTQTSLVNDIVFQTRILSFNASIEAARAGDAGKGFSVVAEEVGRLALSSGKSAKLIDDIVKKNQTETSRTLEYIDTLAKMANDDLSSAVNGGGQSFKLSVEKFAALLRQLEQLQLSIEKIRNAAHEEANAAKRISEVAYRLTEGSQKLQLTSKRLFEESNVSSKMTETIFEKNRDLFTKFGIDIKKSA
ncbi:MAG: methyl-accepting chemotaxis protein [Bdellovibrionaceae bacterium]|nr:methyl-accepting chemotaxis protein [Pseudobdellovibrionaceae bacterium]